MYRDYINERYTDEDLAPYSILEVAENFEEIYAQDGFQILKTLFGFVTYKFIGDAVIIDDLYVKPEWRSKKNAWKLHDVLLRQAQREGKRVMITKSEKAPKNRHLGLAAIKAAKFVKAYDLNEGELFIKGI